VVILEENGLRRWEILTKERNSYSDRKGNNFFFFFFWGCRKIEGREKKENRYIGRNLEDGCSASLGGGRPRKAESKPLKEVEGNPHKEAVGFSAREKVYRER
jgi:hypothetical protein